MHYLALEWLNVALRWTHVFAAIMWVGQTYFFTWLDHAFSKESQVWMVHSGGFYIVDKQKRPELRQQTLHWFKWEAMFTFVFGFLLLILVYYNGGRPHVQRRRGRDVRPELRRLRWPTSATQPARR